MELKERSAESGELGLEVTLCKHWRPLGTGRCYGSAVGWAAQLMLHYPSLLHNTPKIVTGSEPAGEREWGVEEENDDLRKGREGRAIDKGC